MDVQDGIPQAIVHIRERLVTQNASIVDDNVDAPKGINSSFDNGVTILNRTPDPNGLASQLLDLVYNAISVCKIVDSDRRSVLGEREAVSPADAVLGQIVLFLSRS